MTCIVLVISALVARALFESRLIECCMLVSKKADAAMKKVAYNSLVTCVNETT